MPSRPLRHLPIMMLLFALMALSGFATHRIAQQLGIAELQTTGLHRLDLYTASLEREIGKYAFLPGTLVLEGDVLALLGQSDEGKLAARVNAYLEQLNERAGTLAIYVIDTAGKVVASSNWRRADSFIGEVNDFAQAVVYSVDRGARVVQPQPRVTWTSWPVPQRRCAPSRSRPALL